MDTKNEWYTIGRDNKNSIVMRPHGKEMWDLRTNYRFSILPRFLYPMIIDLARIHPGVGFRSGQGSFNTINHDVIVYYPDYLDWSAVIYFMKTWFSEHGYTADLVEDKKQPYLKVKIKGRNNCERPRDGQKQFHEKGTTNEL